MLKDKPVIPDYFTKKVYKRTTGYCENQPVIYVQEERKRLNSDEKDKALQEQLNQDYQRHLKSLDKHES